MQQDFYFYAAIFLGVLFLIAIFVIYSFNRDKLELKRNLTQKEQENFEISSNLTNLVSKNSENLQLISEQKARLMSNHERIDELIGEIDALKTKIAQKDEAEDAMERVINELKESIGTANERAKNNEANFTATLAELNQNKNALAEASERENRLKRDMAVLRNEIEAKKNSLKEQEANLLKVKNELNLEFSNLANKIFEEKSANFTQNSQNSLDLLLKPLKEQISTFQERVNAVHDESVKGMSALGMQIKHISEIGISMSKEANSLATALKGSNKTLGNWGEIQLERTFEASGLVKDEHYLTQQNFKNEEGKRLIPDFIVKIPDGKHLIVDSKVSLIAYEKAITASNEEELNLALKEHIASMKNHIDSLNSKNYGEIVPDSPDFVLMFIPIEPAYIEAMKFDSSLFDYAFQKRVILVSHTTLMPILRTVANLWRIERGNEEAKNIVKSAIKIYDKVRNVAEHMNRLSNTLNTANKHFNALASSFSGRDGLVSRLENFKRLSPDEQKDIEVKEIGVNNELEKEE